MGLERSIFRSKTTRKIDFLNIPTIIHYLFPISHFSKQFDSIWFRADNFNSARKIWI